MSGKSILRVCLLLIVGAGVLVLLIQGSNDSTPNVEPAQLDVPADGEAVVAYYFHGEVRCDTCRKIESTSKSALESSFAAELDSGALIWKPTNMEKPENKHLVEQFGLSHSVLLVAKVEQGKTTDWKALEKVWELVWDDQGFEAYVKDEVRSFLESSG